MGSNSESSISDVLSSSNSMLYNFCSRLASCAVSVRRSWSVALLAAAWPIATGSATGSACSSLCRPCKPTHVQAMSAHLLWLQRKASLTMNHTQQHRCMRVTSTSFGSSVRHLPSFSFFFLFFCVSTDGSEFFSKSRHKFMITSSTGS